MATPGDIFRKIAWKVLCSPPFHFLRPIIRLEFGRYQGKFSSPEAALASVPAFRRSAYDNEKLVLQGIAALPIVVFHFEWSVLFYLQQLLQANQLHAVTDFGGGVGIKFYAFRDKLTFPHNLKWQVVDVPALAAEGRRRLPPDATSLSFHDDLADTVPADVLICSGVIQYARLSMDEIVSRLPAKPRIIILNKVPVSRTQGFYSVENFIMCLSYQVLGPNELAEARTRLGYTLAATWPIPDRDVVVLTPQGFERVPLIGEAWTLNS